MIRRQVLHTGVLAIHISNKTKILILHQVKVFIFLLIRG
jgi:hypothetical protein